MSRKLLVLLSAALFLAAMALTLAPAVPKQIEVLGLGSSDAPSQPAVQSSEDVVTTPQSGTEISPPPATVPMARMLDNLIPERYRDAFVTWRRTYKQNLSYTWLSATVLLWIAFLFSLERLIPAIPGRRLLTANRVLDFCYPVLSSSLRAGIVFFGYGPVRAFYQNNLGFLDLRLLDGLPLLAQGVLAFLITDFAFWFSHWVRHKVPWLWYFHAVHHSQTELSAATVWRSHPLEAFLIFAITLIPLGLFGGDRSAWVVVMALHAIWPYFIHANVKTNLGTLGRFIVSPQFHQVHHSSNPAQYDLNYGEHITLWDWMFGTMEKDVNVYPETGIPDGEFLEEKSTKPHAIVLMWCKHLVYPFMMMGKSLKRTVFMAPGEPSQ